MEDFAVVFAVLIGGGLLAWPFVRRWINRPAAPRTPEPEQVISVQSMSGLPGMYRYEYNRRRLPRGRRNPAPAGVIIHHRTPERPKPPRP